MLKYYPINLDLKNKMCVVAGSGRVAQRKVARLLECGANVRVVGLAVTPGLKALAKKKKIVFKNKHVKISDLSGAYLVIAATSDSKTNSFISSYCLKKGILVNVIDAPKECNFILPSLVCRGDLIISISTSGLCPALAKRIRQDLEKRFGPEYAAFLRLMETVRPKVIKNIKNPRSRKAFFEKASGSGVLALMKKNNFSRVRKTLERLIKNG